MSTSRTRATSEHTLGGVRCPSLLPVQILAVGVALLCQLGLGAVSAHALAPYRSLFAFPDNPTSMSGPSSVVVAPNGDYIIADAGTASQDAAGGGFHRIRVLSPTGELLASWGSKGTGLGKFRAPQALALGPDNRVYLADTFNNRVQVFERNGTFVRSWGTSGTANGQMIWPRGIAVDSNNVVYVSDTGNARIQVFSAEGAFQRTWGSLGKTPETFNQPMGIAVDSEFMVYVVDANKLNVKKFEPGANATSTPPVRTWGWTEGQQTNTSRYSSPRGITLSHDGRSLLIADTGNARIEQCDFMGNSLETTGSLPVSAAVGRFNQPRGAATDASGRLVVADTLNARIQRSVSGPRWAGAWETPWYTPSSSPGLLFAPEGVAADPNTGVTYVADTANSRVLRYARDGSYLGVFAPAGSDPGQVDAPRGVLVSPDGSVLVADSGNGRIQVFTAAGDYVRAIGVGVLNGPSGMAFSDVGTGVLFVADTGNSRVARFDWPTGAALTHIGSLGSGPYQFNAPRGVTLAGTNHLWVADTGNDRVQKYNVGGVPTWLSLSGREGGPVGSHLNNPSAILAQGTDVLVADTTNNRLLRCDAQGQWTEEYTGADTNAGAFDAPVALAAGPQETLLALERGGCRVQVLMRDDAPPVTTIIGLPAARVQSASISFSATDTVSGSGVASTYVRLDGGATQAATATIPVSTEGTHTLDYWSEDRAGNVEPSQHATFTIDLTPPSGDFVFSSGSTVSSSTTVSLTSAVPEASEMRVGVATQWGEWGPYAETTQVVLPSLDATYTARMEYRDVAGNTLLRTRDIRLDRLGPSVMGLSSPSHPTADPVWGPITANWESAADLSGVAGYSAIVDTSPVGVPPTTVGLVAPMGVFESPVPEGVWYLHVRAADAVGNWGAVQTISGVSLADTQPPVTTHSGVPSAAVNSTVTISLQAEDSISGVADIRYRFTPFSEWIAYSVPIVVSTEATHVVEYQARDRAGNVEDVRSRTFTIDRTGPEVGDIRFRSEGGSYTAEWDAPSDVSGVVGYAVLIDRLAGSSPGTSTQEATSTSFGPPEGDGWYAHVQALDAAGNWGPVRHERYDKRASTLTRPILTRRLSGHRIVLTVSGRLIVGPSAGQAEAAPAAPVRVIVERLNVASNRWEPVSATLRANLVSAAANQYEYTVRVPLVRGSVRCRVLYDGDPDYQPAVSPIARAWFVSK